MWSRSHVMIFRKKILFWLELNKFTPRTVLFYWILFFLEKRIFSDYSCFCVLEKLHAGEARDDAAYSRQLSQSRMCILWTIIMGLQLFLRLIKIQEHTKSQIKLIRLKLIEAAGIETDELIREELILDRFQFRVRPNDESGIPFVWENAWRLSRKWTLFLILSLSLSLFAFVHAVK